MQADAAGGGYVLCLTGRARLVGPLGPTLLSAKAYPLVVFLASCGPDHSAGRARIAELLWPDELAERSLTNLRQLLARIRSRERECGFRLLDTSPAEVRLAPEGLAIDLLEIEALVEAEGASGIPDLCRLYGGDLLEGAAEDIVADQDWLGTQRTRLRNRVTARLSRFVDIESADETTLLVAAERLLDIEPFEELAYRALMRVHARRGQPFQVRRVFELCRERLEVELGTEPTAATVTLYRELVRRTGPGGSVLPRAQAGAGVPRVSILLPSDGRGQSDGLSLVAWLLQDVTIGLCRLQSVSIVAPYTSWSLHSDETEVALSKYGIDYLVVTDHVREGDDCYLYVKLVDTGSRQVRWGERLAFGLPRLATCYRELSMRIAASLADAVEQSELEQLDGSTDPNAYRWYLAGQRELQTLDLQSIRKARKAFKQAHSLCADYAPAYSGLSRVQRLEWLLLARGDRAPLEASIALAERAIEIDPEDARGYHELGTACLYARAFERSVECFEEAERRSPQHADLITDFGETLAHSGEPEAGLKKLDQAISLNPATPDHYLWCVASMQYQLERYGDAITTIGKMGDKTWALRLLAASNAKLGRASEARRCVRKAMETYPDFRIERWTAMIPNRRPEDTRRYADGLRLAGFR